MLKKHWDCVLNGVSRLSLLFRCICYGILLSRIAYGCSVWYAVSEAEAERYLV